ncbi:MAG: GNAT family N-acetyltransferase [Candidatus Eremiobacteraeota bacterium]|nr:GNAT family N-acetyltransferase [Candidatus Eremiobacteraeota bacterium]
MRTITTRRLRLVPVGAQNARVLWALLQRRELRQYQDLPNLSTDAFRDAVAKRPRSLRAGSSGRFEWLVQMIPHSDALGWLSLRIADREPEVGEIGYSILPEFCGKGIATEAVRALLVEGFEHATLRRITAYCVPENTASVRVLNKLGFKSSGMLRKGATVNGRAVDVMSYAIQSARGVP